MTMGFEDFSLVLVVTRCENSGLCNDNGLWVTQSTNLSPIVKERAMNSILYTMSYGYRTIEI